MKWVLSIIAGAAAAGIVHAVCKSIAKSSESSTGLSGWEVTLFTWVAFFIVQFNVGRWLHKKGQ